MNHSLIGFFIVLTSLASYAYAHDDRHSLPELGSASENYRLHKTYAGMSHSEYRQVAGYNRQMLSNYAQQTVHNGLSRIGVSDNVAGATGATAQIALGGQASVNLNSSKTFFLEVDDAIQRDRAMSIRWKVAW